MITPEALRGYVLEELLAKLLQASGYDLLVSPAQDPAALEIRGNGLRIRGRGTSHQVDVLGQLRSPVPFSFPIRLFLEAKCRKDKTGLADVRNALGVINDVNEHYSTAGAAVAATSYRRYLYRYTLFSTSGFTRPAQEFAITQQISLVDLQGPAFGWLFDVVRRISDALLGLAAEAGVSSFPVGQVREALRRGLGTWPFAESIEPDDLDATEALASAATASPSEETLPARRLASIVAGAADELDGRLYVAFTQTPFFLVLQPDDPEIAEQWFFRRSPESPASLVFAGHDETHGEWAMTSTEGFEPVTFRLALPPLLEPVVLSHTSDRELPGLRPETVQRMSVAHDGTFASLRFLPLRSPEVEDPNEAPELSLRRAALSPSLAFGPATTEAKWPAEAIRALLELLRAERWPHANIIVAAANSRGSITRPDVYAIAGYPQTRMLRGFTRPVRRLRRRLVEQGLLSPDAAEALQTRYSGGVMATHFVVPEEFVETLSSG